MYKGKLKRWNEKKGFGFISPEDDNSDVFIHITALKKMRRKPRVGDIIYYEIHTQSDGRKRAVNASIEGVKEITSRFKQKANTTLKPKLFVFLVLVFIALFVYQRLTHYKGMPETKNIPATITPEQQTKFKCDGRQYCGQMKSRAEANFFIRNCPNTKMDGDYDGIPCENDTRF